MSQIVAVPEENTIPELGALRSRATPPTGDPRRDTWQPMRWAYVPLVLSLAAHWVFFVAHWVPEVSRFPGHEALLTQLWPLVSTGLGSDGVAVVAAQLDRSTWPAGWLLVVALALPWLARSRWWWARLALWPLTYLSVVFILVMLFGLILRGQLGSAFLGTIALVVWAYAAVLTTWRSLFSDPETLPPRPRLRTKLLVAYAVVLPTSLAVGRRLFAPELAQAATDLADDPVGLRWAALATSATAPLWLSGLAVGAGCWAIATVVALRREPALAGAGRSRLVWPSTVLVVSVVLGLGVAGLEGAGLATTRSTQIRTQDPASEMAFVCGSWSLPPERPGDPSRSLVAHGVTCRQLSAFVGFRQQTTTKIGGSISPVRADGPDGRRLTGRTVAARYGDLVVLATTSRIDNRADGLSAVRIGDASEAWSFVCPGDVTVALRFAGSSGPPDAGAGRSTVAGERPSVVVTCGTATVLLDPVTGRVRS